jgi:heptosyltransferase-2
VKLTEGTIDKSHFKRILILQTAFIGDVVLTIPLIRLAKECFPDSEIHFLTIPNSKTIVETLPYISRLWIFDKRGKDKGLRGLFRFSSELRHQNFDLAIVPHRSLRSALLLSLARIPIKIGFNNSKGFFLLNHKIEYQKSSHEIERNLSLLNYICPLENENKLPEIIPSKHDLELVNEFLKQNIEEKTKYISLAPGSIWLTKRWPVHYWVKLTYLLQSKGFKTILIGSDADSYIYDEFQKLSDKEVINAIGQFDIRQSAEIIRRSKLLVCNDSAPTHLGVAVGTPVLTIFGSTSPEYGFYPYGEKNRIAELKNLECRPCTDHGKRKCPLDHYKCMIDLLPEEVFKISMEMINAD